MEEVSSPYLSFMRRASLITVAIILLCAVAPCRAQDDDIPLGDVARAARKEKPAEPERPVIDNDNLPIMMDKAETERLDGKPVFSIDPSGKSFRMTSPDGTCSLSFDARAAALISTPYISSDLPSYEVAKLEGAATIHDGFLEVTVRNGTDWELKEIVVGVTVLNQSGVEAGQHDRITGRSPASGRDRALSLEVDICSGDHQRFSSGRER
jgi:hypothetical protein